MPFDKLFVCMKIRFLKLKNWIALSLVGLLGFNACQSTKNTPKNDDSQSRQLPNPRSEIALMYGVPTVNYMLRGHVYDADGNPLQGVQVVLLEGFVDATPDGILGEQKFVDRYLADNAVTTNEKGEFYVSMKTSVSNNIRLLVRDVDGESNGSFQNKLMPISVEPRKNGNEANGWDLGSAEADIKVQLDRK